MRSYLCFLQNNSTSEISEIRLAKGLLHSTEAFLLCFHCLKPCARTRIVAVQEPKRFSVYDISFVIEKMHSCSSPPSSNCEQSQPLLKSVPPSDENKADKTH